MEWVAEMKYTYMVLPTLAPFELRRQAAEYFSACCDKAGYTVRHSQIGWGIGIYVAETDEEAQQTTIETVMHRYRRPRKRLRRWLRHRRKLKENDDGYANEKVRPGR